MLVIACMFATAVGVAPYQNHSDPLPTRLHRSFTHDTERHKRSIKRHCQCLRAKITTSGPAKSASCHNFNESKAIAK